MSHDFVTDLFSFPLLPPTPLLPLPPPLPQHPVAGIQHRGVPAPLGTKTLSGGEGTSCILTQPDSDKVSLEPPSSRALSHAHR